MPGLEDEPVSSSDYGFPEDASRSMETDALNPGRALDNIPRRSREYLNRREGREVTGTGGEAGATRVDASSATISWFTLPCSRDRWR